jgi:hypothetical protein
MWLRRACRGGEKNALAFERKRKDVLIKTQVRFDQNASAFEVKCTCVLPQTHLRFSLTKI